MRGRVLHCCRDGVVSGRGRECCREGVVRGGGRESVVEREGDRERQRVF